MTLEDRLERLANRTPPGDAAEVLVAARTRAKRPPQPHDRRYIAGAAALLAAVALAAGALAFAVGGDSDSTTVAGPDADIASQVTVPDSGAAASQLADGTPVWVVRHDDGSVSVLDAVSTHRPFGAGTLVGWCDSSRGFLDPMYGSQFDEHGGSQAGPAPRGLDSYPVASVDGNTATVTGPPVEQPRAADGGPKPSAPTGSHCLDETSTPVDGYLSGSFDVHPFDPEAAVSPTDAVRQPDGTLVLVDAPIVISNDSQPLVCISEVAASPPSCDGLPAPELFLNNQEIAVLSGPFIARPAKGTLVNIAYIGERAVTQPSGILWPELDSCSAEGLPAEPSPQEGLPVPVEQARRQIVAAAVACDLGRLAQLMPGRFVASFGGDETRQDAIELFHNNEANGGDILRLLVEILDRPHRSFDSNGETYFAWPSAFGYEGWDAVPLEDREALRPLYDDEDFAGFKAFGGYIGYRAVIRDDGEWRNFVAGD